VKLNIPLITALEECTGEVMRAQSYNRESKLEVRLLKYADRKMLYTDGAVEYNG